MNLERILTLLILVVAILAAIPQIPVAAGIWGVALVLIGLASGLMSPAGDITQRIAIYVIAATLPTISNALDPIWVVGPWVNTVLDSMATGIQGMALGLFLMAFKDRVLPAAQATE